MIEFIAPLLFAFLLGICLGSFANVVVIRLHEMSSPFGRSRCMSCQRKLRPKHMVPIFSWLMLGGRCADCGAKIHFQYPLVEFAAGALAVLTALRANPFGANFAQFYFELFLLLALLVIVVMDLRWKELPVEIMAAVGLIGSGWRIGNAAFFGDWQITAYQTVIGVAAAVIFFGCQWFFSRGRWLGSGDVWFGAMMGLVLGWPKTGIAIYLAYIIGGVGVAALFVLGVVKKGSRVPFAPALALGLISALWFGDAIQNWLGALFL